jgi:hypothetical protein
MINQIRTFHPVLGFTACLILALAAPAHAANRNNQNGHPNQQQHVAQRAHWRGHDDNNGYHRQPDMYYSAPPAVYQPPGYYQQPGASLSFIFPFFQ